LLFCNSGACVHPPNERCAVKTAGDCIRGFPWDCSPLLCAQDPSLRPRRPEAEVLKRNFTQKLSRPCPGNSSSCWTGVPTHSTSVHLILHVPAPNVTRKGFDQVIRKPLAPKPLSTHRAAGILPLENVDSQRSLAFQRTPLCHNIRFTCTLTFSRALLLPHGMMQTQTFAPSGEIAFPSGNIRKLEFEGQAALALGSSGISDLSTRDMS
jgi:hypothetical protein